MNKRDSPTELIPRTRVSFIVTSDLLRVFAESYGYLEHYFINDPVIGKTVNLTVKGRTHRLTTPIIEWTLLYHIYPVMVIYFLVGFVLFFDSISFKERHKRRRAALLGVANVISAMMVEDFSWFYYRWLLPLDNDPKKGFLMQTSDWTTKNLGYILYQTLSLFVLSILLQL